jgi:pimeloyl-ACP methyl ester carboxylesterase
MSWMFTAQEAAQIRQPVLSVLGENSSAVDPSTGEVHAMLQDWIPQTETLEVPGSTHTLQMAKPGEVAPGLAAFFQRHPMGA